MFKVSLFFRKMYETPFSVAGSGLTRMTDGSPPLPVRLLRPNKNGETCRSFALFLAGQHVAIAPIIHTQ